MVLFCKNAETMSETDKNKDNDPGLDKEEEILSQMRKREAENEALKKILAYLNDQPENKANKDSQ